MAHSCSPKQPLKRRPRRGRAQQAARRTDRVAPVGEERGDVEGHRAVGIRGGTSASRRAAAGARARAEGDAGAGVPAAQPAGRLRVVGEEEVLDGVPGACGPPGAVGGRQPVGPLGVRPAPASVHSARRRAATGDGDDGGQCAVQPPSMTSELPVTDVAAGEHRNATASATSSGSISRLIAAGASMTCSTTSSSDRPWARRLVGDLALDERGAHVGGVDAVGGDAVLGALHAMTLDSPSSPCLAVTYADLYARGAQPVDGAHVHDPAPAAAVHVRQRAADQPERRLDHQPQDVAEAVDRELVDRGDVLQAGVVDQDVDVEVQGVDRVEVGQVDGHRGAAHLLGGGGRGVGVPVDHDDRAPRLGQPGRAGAPDARRPAGDECAPSVQNPPVAMAARTLARIRPEVAAHRRGWRCPGSLPTGQSSRCASSSVVRAARPLGPVASASSAGSVVSGESW